MEVCMCESKHIIYLMYISPYSNYRLYMDGQSITSYLPRHSKSYKEV